MWPNPQFPADLVTFTEEILNGKLYFLCSEKLVFDRVLNTLLSSWVKHSSTWVMAKPIFYDRLKCKPFVISFSKMLILIMQRAFGKLFCKAVSRDFKTSVYFLKKHLAKNYYTVLYYISVHPEWFLSYHERLYFQRWN